MFGTVFSQYAYSHGSGLKRCRVRLKQRIVVDCVPFIVYLRRIFLTKFGTFSNQFCFYLVNASLIQWFKGSIDLIRLSLHTEVTWINDVCGVENSAGSRVPKRSTRNPFQEACIDLSCLSAPVSTWNLISKLKMLAYIYVSCSFQPFLPAYTPKMSICFSFAWIMNPSNNSLGEMQVFYFELFLMVNKFFHF